MADTTMHAAESDRTSPPKPAQAASSSTGGAAAAAALLQPPNYHMVSSTAAHSRPIAALKFSHDGRFLASAGADAALRIYTLVEGEAQSVPSSSSVGSLSRPTPTLYPYAEVLGAHACGINDLVFTYDGRHVLTASDDMTIVVWDLLAVDPPSAAATAAAAAPLGSSGGAVAPALPTLRPLRSYRGHTSYVFCLAVSALNNMLVSGSYDETVRIWDLKNAKMLRLIKAHSDPVSAVDFNRDGTLIVSSSYDGLCRVWETSSGRCLKTIYNEKTPPVSVLPRARLPAAPSAPCDALRWGVVAMAPPALTPFAPSLSLSPLYALVSNPSSSFVRFSPNGKYILASSLDHTLRLWDYQRRDHCLKTYTSPSEYVNSKFCVSSAFSTLHTDQHIVCGSEDGAVVFWAVVSAKVVARLFPPASATAAAAVTRKEAGANAAAGKDAGQQREPVLCVACHPSLPVLASAAMDAPFSIVLWAHAQ